MNGTVYTGVAYFPKHPQADLHGLVRCVVRTSSVMKLAEALRIYDIPFSPMLLNQGIWNVSASIVEQRASESHYGEVLVSPLWCQYLEPDFYEPVPKSLKVGTGKGQQSSVVPEGQQTGPVTK